MARTESEVEWAKSELERNGTLFRGGLIAARDVDNARNLHNVAVSRMAVAISARDQHPDQMRMAEAQVDSDRAALRVAEAEVARREATLGIAQKRLGDTTIRAPFAGVIAKRLVNAGEYVKDNTPLFNLVAVDPLKYTGTVPERFAPDLKDRPAPRADRGGLPRPELRRARSRACRPRSRCRRAASPSRAASAMATAGCAPASSPRATSRRRRTPRRHSCPPRPSSTSSASARCSWSPTARSRSGWSRAGPARARGWRSPKGVKPGETVAVSNLSQLFNGAPVTLIEAKAAK